jgi:hypothetical protein
LPSGAKFRVPGPASNPIVRDARKSFRSASNPLEAAQKTKTLGNETIETKPEARTHRPHKRRIIGLQLNSQKKPKATSIILLNWMELYASKVVDGTVVGTTVKNGRKGQVRAGMKIFQFRLAGSMAIASLLAMTAVTVHAGDKKKKVENAAAYYTPMPLDSGYGPMDLNEPKIPPEEIIKQFEAKETGFREALNHYTYRRTVRVQTVGDDNKVDGEYYEIDDVIFDPTGKRVEKVVYAPANTLTRIGMTPADFQDLQERLPFVLTAADAGQYDIKYLGRQKVDTVDCYVFDVAPKVIEKGKRYFQGKIWVDAEELEIVVTSGKNVPDDLRKGHEDLSTPFTTYREQIDGANWFPTYTKGDGVLHFPSGNGYITNDVHVRQTVKYSDYKQYGSTEKLIYEGQEVKQDPNASKPDASKPSTPPK